MEMGACSHLKDPCDMKWDGEDPNVGDGLGKGTEGISLVGIFVLLKGFRLPGRIGMIIVMTMFVTMGMTAMTPT